MRKGNVVPLIMFVAALELVRCQPDQSITRTPEGTPATFTPVPALVVSPTSAPEPTPTEQAIPTPQFTLEAPNPEDASKLRSDFIEWASEKGEHLLPDATQIGIIQFAVSQNGDEQKYQMVTLPPVEIEGRQPQSEAAFWVEAEAQGNPVFSTMSKDQSERGFVTWSYVDPTDIERIKSGEIASAPVHRVLRYRDLSSDQIASLQQLLTSGRMTLEQLQQLELGFMPPNTELEGQPFAILLPEVGGEISPETKIALVNLVAPIAKAQPKDSTPANPPGTGSGEYRLVYPGEIGKPMSQPEMANIVQNSRRLKDGAGGNIPLRVEDWSQFAPNNRDNQILDIVAVIARGPTLSPEGLYYMDVVVAANSGSGSFILTTVVLGSNHPEAPVGVRLAKGYRTNDTESSDKEIDTFGEVLPFLQQGQGISFRLWMDFSDESRNRSPATDWAAARMKLIILLAPNGRRLAEVANGQGASVNEVQGPVGPVFDFLVGRVKG